MLDRPADQATKMSSRDNHHSSMLGMTDRRMIEEPIDSAFTVP